MILKNNSRAPDALENDILTMIKSVCIEIQICTHTYICTFKLLEWQSFPQSREGKNGSEYACTSSCVQCEVPKKFSFAWGTEEYRKSRAQVTSHCSS